MSRHTQMLFNPFDFLTTVVGYFVYWIAYKVLVGKHPEFTARNLARLTQIIAVAILGPILSPLPFNPLSILSTLVYVVFLITNLVLVNILVAAGKFLKVKIQIISSYPSSNKVIKSIMEWLSPYKIKLESVIAYVMDYLERVRRIPVLRVLVSVLKGSLYLIEIFLYPYIIKPLALDLFIYILNCIEKWVDWLSENVLQAVLGEIVTKIIQIFSLFSVTIPLSVLVIIRNILDYFLKK